MQPTREEEGQPVPDLMSALKASLDQVRSRESADGDGAAKRKPAAKKPAAKKAPAKKPPAKKPPAKKPAASRTKAKS